MHRAQRSSVAGSCGAGRSAGSVMSGGHSWDASLAEALWLKQKSWPTCSVVPRTRVVGRRVVVFHDNRLRRGPQRCEVRLQRLDDDQAARARFDALDLAGAHQFVEMRASAADGEACFRNAGEELVHCVGGSQNAKAVFMPDLVS